MLFAKSLHDQGIDNPTYDDLIKGMKDMLNNSAQCKPGTGFRPINNSLQQVKMKAHVSTHKEEAEILATNKTRTRYHHASVVAVWSH